MKRIPSLLLPFLLLCASGFTQTSVSRIFIKGGKDAWENYMKEVYEYPVFQSGVVVYKNGERYKSQLNYNNVLGAIQFVDDKGDTLALSKEETINTVTIGSDLYYYYPPTCLRQIAGNDKLKLARNVRIYIADKQKVGALGIPNSTGTIESYDHTDTRSRNRFDLNEELLLRKTTIFYMGNGDNLFVIASRKNILKLFPKFETAIKKYLNDNPTDFNKVQDLEKLTAYMAEL